MREIKQILNEVLIVTNADNTVYSRTLMLNLPQNLYIHGKNIARTIIYNIVCDIFNKQDRDRQYGFYESSIAEDYANSILSKCYDVIDDFYHATPVIDVDSIKSVIDLIVQLREQETGLLNISMDVVEYDSKRKFLLMTYTSNPTMTDKIVEDYVNKKKAENGDEPINPYLLQNPFDWAFATEEWLRDRTTHSF